ncbi:XRE family transcriptional regulator [Hafnia alvei]|uniref:XRE family transcriptional regulator n=1 Tax=Hafnia TaxID=568 RepID=UPI0021F48D90|nr:helix-turn-helix transcriptional regulator [Hafnia alvei]ELR4878254.1 helix-turn-helix transcriptional regulator [Escherichia coli]MCV9379966.1 helix-turn-helix transcriptional regulator [Hafnia alvei]MDX6845787.1 helix-turn-helix transcriptional regulator [Hafnia alvei]
MNTLAGRVRLARERAKITQHQLAEKIGTSQQSIAKIERGETLQPRKIKQIALALGVSVKWLQFGNIEENAIDSSYVVKEWEAVSPDPYLFTEIPILDIELSAGNGCEAEVVESEDSTYPFRRDELRKHGVTPSEARLVHIHGNSLYPVLTDGDKVAVDISQNHPIKDGDLYAIRDGVLLRVKILINRPDGGLVLRSFNKEEYPDEILNLKECRSRINVIGRVFWSSRSW